jgi:hypothetical protein
MTVFVIVSDCCGSCGRVCAVVKDLTTATLWVTYPPKHGTCRDSHVIEEHTVIEKVG